MDVAARAVGIAEVNDVAADPSRDVELGHVYSRKSEAGSRASLPGSYQRTTSLTNNRRAQSAQENSPAEGDTGVAAGDEEQGDTESMGWNEEHPCWPHPNPHVPEDSKLFHSTRIIRIRRDWTITGDRAPTFSALYPEILEPLLPEARFRELIAHLNENLQRTCDPYALRNIVDVSLGVVTGLLWRDLGLTKVKRDLAKLEKWLENWNRTHGQLPEFRIIPLQWTAYMSLDIQIPDPQIGPDTEPTEVDTRSLVGSQVARSGRTLSFKKSSPGRSQSRAKSDHSSSIGRPTDDVAYGPYPVVPPIPGKYLEEAQKQVSKQHLGREMQTIDTPSSPETQNQSPVV